MTHWSYQQHHGGHLHLWTGKGKAQALRVWRQARLAYVVEARLDKARAASVRAGVALGKVGGAVLGGEPAWSGEVLGARGQGRGASPELRYIKVTRLH